MAERFRIEKGHKFDQALLNPSAFLPRNAQYLSVNAAAVDAFLICLGEHKAHSPALFVGGRVYDQVEKDPVPTYREPSNWPQVYEEVLTENGKTLLTGRNFDLHDIDPVAGAGMALFHASISPIHVINAEGRIGDGTIKEGAFSQKLGNSVLFVVKPEQYNPVTRYIVGKSSQYPHEVLPTYWGNLHLTARQIVPGLENLSDFIHVENRKIRLDPDRFRDRDIGVRELQAILHYLTHYTNFQGQDFRKVEQLVATIQQKSKGRRARKST